MSRKVSTEHRAFAKSQRGMMSAAERALWDILRAGRLDRWKFKRQQPIGIYVVDFICFEARLIVEADGSLHESGEARRHDARRDSWLCGEGFRMLRLPNDLILGAPDRAVERIAEALMKSQRG